MGSRPEAFRLQKTGRFAKPQTSLQTKPGSEMAARSRNSAAPPFEFAEYARSKFRYGRDRSTRNNVSGNRHAVDWRSREREHRGQAPQRRVVEQAVLPQPGNHQHVGLVDPVRQGLGVADCEAV